MTVFTSEKPLVWGELDVPLLGLARDWQGESLEPPVAWSLVRDPERLWFVVHHTRPADLHPLSRPGGFLPELWKHDCAELFIAHRPSGRYIEFNLAPNAAWWCGEFSAPRVPADGGDQPMPDVSTFMDMDAAGAWLVAMAMPLDLLEARVGFGPDSVLNVTMITGSPDQRFLSVTDLGGGEPDFHRPDRFSQAEFRPLAK